MEKYLEQWIEELDCFISDIEHRDIPQQDIAILQCMKADMEHCLNELQQ